LAAVATAQPRVGVIVPDDGVVAAGYSEKLADAFSGRVPLLDEALVRSAFDAQHIDDPFNQSQSEAKRLASAAGCEFIVLVRADTLRRASFERDDYYESFAAVYLVSARTGSLVSWQLKTFEAPFQDKATESLFLSAKPVTDELVSKMNSVSSLERNRSPINSIETVPDDAAQRAQDLRLPVPYKRIKPAYTRVAGFYNIRATIDVLADISETGEVTRTEVVRWGGYGLDESVISTIQSMNWRPATRSGKPLAMRVLLRYNFTKIENGQ
jgi:hypothetical protein